MEEKERKRPWKRGRMRGGHGNISFLNNSVISNDDYFLWSSNLLEKYYDIYTTRLDLIIRMIVRLSLPEKAHSYTNINCNLK